MLKKSLILLLLSIAFQAPNAFGQTCFQLFSAERDSSSQFLKEIESYVESYRKDLYSNSKSDPLFFHNFARKTDDYYSIEEVLQNYPIPQAKESAENILVRLKYVRDHWTDFSWEGKNAELFPLEIYQKLIAKGEALLKNNEWPFYETMDFLDAGLIYGASIRSKKENGEEIIDPTYVEIRNNNILKHGLSDPSLIYMFSSKDSGRAFEYFPHPAIIHPFFVQDKLFEIREFNWAFTKGAFLISVAPHFDINPHGVGSSYYAFYHDISGHFRATAIRRTLKYLEAIYVRKGLQKIDEKNGNNKEAIKFLKAYIKMRENFLKTLLTSGEKNLSLKDQEIFHETIFDYIHEGGGAIEPQRMRDFISKKKDKNSVDAFILQTLEKYISTHNLEIFK